MSEANDFSMLTWVRQEIGEVLANSRQAIEDYSDRLSDASYLDLLSGYLLQIKGTLKIIEVDGANSLVEEVEYLTAAIREDAVSDKGSACHSIMQALIQLPEYLDCLIAGVRDIPVVLLPVINEMRLHRGENALLEGSMFCPDYSIDLPNEVTDILNDASLKDHAKSLRRDFQVGLLGFLREQDSEDSLNRMLTILTTAMRVSQRPDIARLWWIGATGVIVLGDEAVKHNVTVKVLLGRLDLCLKRVAESGENILSVPEVDGLCSGLLYFIAQSNSRDPAVQQVRDLFSLDDLLPRDDEMEIINSRLSGKNSELFATVGQIIIDELEKLKDTLDILMRGSDENLSDEIRDINIDMSMLSDTLGMVGLHVEREIVLDTAKQLSEYISGEQLPEVEQYIDIAESLLHVESVVGNLSRGEHLKISHKHGMLEKAEDHEFDQVRSVVFTEALSDLGNARELLTICLQEYSNEDLTEAVRLLSQVKGGLLLLGEKRPADIVGQLEGYFEKGLSSNDWVSPVHEQEALADALCGVELYLEGLRDSGKSVDQPLQLSEKRIIDLFSTKEDLSASEPVEQAYDSEAQISHSIGQAGEIEKNIVDDIEKPTPINEFAEMSQEIADANELSDQYESELEAFPVLDGEMDEEILEIFLEEAEEEIASITQNIPICQSTGNQDALEAIRRSFHTLKGSGRLVGAMRIGEFAWSIESFLNRVLKDHTVIPEDVYVILDQTVLSLQELVGQLKQGSLLTQSVARLMSQADMYSGQPQSVTNEIDIEPAQDDTDSRALPANKISIEEEISVSESENVTCEFSGDVDEIGSDALFDPVLMDIFREETLSHLSDIDVFVQAQDYRVTEDLLRALHTLRGSARMTSVQYIDDISGKLEAYFTKLNVSDENLPGHSYDLLEHGREYIASFLEQLPGEITEPDGYRSYLNSLEKEIHKIENPVIEKNVEPDSHEAFAPVSLPESDNYADCDEELLAIFLDESQELLRRNDATIAVWSSSVANSEITDRFLRELHTLKGSARMAQVPAIAELAHAMELVISDICDAGAQEDGEAIACIQVAHDRLHNQLEFIQLRQPMQNSDALLDKLQAIQLRLRSDRRPDNGHLETKGFDPELLRVFTEEAEDILNLCESTLQRWKSAPNELSIIAELQRELHTLKGGARMADVSEIGDLAHAIESLLTRATRGQLAPSENLFIVLDRSIDRLCAMVACLNHGNEMLDATDLVSYLEALDRGESIEISTIDEPGQNNETEEGFVDRRKSLRISHELVRVRADMLDQLVNHAGEVSIYRSRLEQKNSSYRFNLGEMDQTVHRLREQLRKMEIETEAQILFGYEKEESKNDFDPLEMDRYSRLQQLSRSLMESVADLSSIQGLLENITRESETLLLQQSRVSSDLQEGLMRTRMVPFLSLAPRLRRIVRQTAQELGKNVELKFSGAEGELDRTVIDRIIAPIEHMLRNAIAHGVEKPARRITLGKTEICQLNIDFSRDASDVVLHISDDGAGIDIEKVRDRATAKGMISHDVKISDQEILQLILESGLSTADEVTQVAGRGVGMDVVNSEVKQLGGSLKIESEKNKGATFIVRLPFTVALNKALLVEVGEDSYAIPLTNVQGVVRIEKDELRKYYDDKSELLEYGGNEYEVHYLGELLGTHRPNFSAMKKTESLLLVNSKEYSVALQVDNLNGSREIVVKSIGRQISTVHGVSGATILGDGRVVMILELAPLLRIGASVMAQVDELLQTPVLNKGVTVMVVDDSITVRKVTSRLLEKYDYQVITAKDGIDAVARLHETIPNMILMDIEMPRMDGFELATYVRNDSRLRDVPIVMITSRTGNKHRARAFEIGVNEFLGKPFQEADLMNTIRQFLITESFDSEE